MTNRLQIRLTCCALTLVAGTMMAAEARAGGYGGYGAGSYVYAYYPFQAHIPILADRSIPYYSVHPPVYYSHIIARPYGYTPYAYYPGIVTPGLGLRKVYQPGESGYFPMEGYGGRSRAPSPTPAPPEPAQEKAGPKAAFRGAVPRPAVIENQYVAGDAVSPSQPARRALRIANPYCADQEDREAGDAGAVVDAPRRAPKVVFPVASAPREAR